VPNDVEAPTNLVGLKFTLMNLEIDKWNDPVYRQHILVNNPELAGKKNVKVLVEDEYTVGIGLYTIRMLRRFMGTLCYSS